MTNQFKLFRGPLEKLKKKRQIQVGGGILWSEARGTVRVKANDGSFYYLKDCLFVPGLGINLISAQCLCRDGIVGIHDSKNMYFKKLDEFLQFRNDHKTFLHAKQKNGLYMLKSIFSETPELAFVSNESKSVKSPVDTNTQGEITDEGPDISEHDEASKFQRNRYRLTHRRFGHYGSDALRHLHEVASGIKKISIPEKEKRICESCKIGKMKRKISKELEVHKDKVLAQISIDNAGPFVMSIGGFEYFLQIVDSYSRKIWTIPLKTKDQAISALREWKL
ncbi:hypothetical protein K3495_g8924 [Podosphaera aphanis]|nr:hypothetical protein K3495_g8924 [Podosphaera aphanis]